MTRPMRLLIGYGLQALILLFVVGGLLYNVGGVRDKIASHFAHSIAQTVNAPSPTASTTPTPHRGRQSQP